MERSGKSTDTNVDSNNNNEERREDNTKYKPRTVWTEECVELKKEKIMRRERNGFCVFVATAVAAAAAAFSRRRRRLLHFRFVLRFVVLCVLPFRVCGVCFLDITHLVRYSFVRSFGSVGRSVRSLKRVPFVMRFVHMCSGSFSGSCGPSAWVHVRHENTETSDRRRRRRRAFETVVYRSFVAFFHLPLLRSCYFRFHRWVGRSVCLFSSLVPLDSFLRTFEFRSWFLAARAHSAQSTGECLGNITWTWTEITCDGRRTATESHI